MSVPESRGRGGLIGGKRGYRVGIGQGQLQGEQGQGWPHRGRAGVQGGHRVGAVTGGAGAGVQGWPHRGKAGTGVAQGQLPGEQGESV
jgi:hypothetical protein